jgi:hypothetical protein
MNGGAEAFLLADFTDGAGQVRAPSEHYGIPLQNSTTESGSQLLIVDF